MNEDFNLCTNRELKELQLNLNEEFEATKKIVVEGMLKMETLEKKYTEITNILKKRNVLNE